MAKLIILNEAIKSGLIKDGDLVNPVLCFPKYNSSAVIEDYEIMDLRCNYTRAEVFIREEDLKWFYYLKHNITPTLIGETTKFTLKLKGGPGYRNRSILINRILSTYTNYNLEFIARSISLSDINQIRDNRVLYKLFKANARKAHIDYDDSTKELSGHKKNGMIDITQYSCCAGVCPVISLNPEKILIDIQSKEMYGEWRLIPAI